MDSIFRPSVRAGVVLALGVLVLAVMAYRTVSVSPPPPVTATAVAGRAIASPPPVSATPAGEQLAQIGPAVIADWEAMFRATQSYESVHAEGRPGDKAWWTGQVKRFYTGRALSGQLQYLDEVFRPASMAAPGFIEGARYSAEVTGCSSAVECTLKVNLQAGKFWAYHVRTQSWSEANAIEPTEWVIPMQYDPVAEHWKIK